MCTDVGAWETGQGLSTDMGSKFSLENQSDLPPKEANSSKEAE